MSDLGRAFEARGWYAVESLELGARGSDQRGCVCGGLLRDEASAMSAVGFGVAAASEAGVEEGEGHLLATAVGVSHVLVCVGVEGRRTASTCVRRVRVGGLREVPAAMIGIRMGGSKALLLVLYGRVG